MKKTLEQLWQTHIPEQYHDSFDSVYAYFELLIKVNKQVNFFSRKMLPEVLFTDHIIDCALALPHFKNSKVILDFGTGGGLPGMVLAICEPNKKFFLLDKSNKKIHYLKRIIEDCVLKNAEATTELNKQATANIDLVTSRAVGSLQLLLEKTNPLNLSSCQNFLIYKGRMEKINEEVDELKTKYKINILPIVHPEGKERHLVSLKK